MNRISPLKSVGLCLLRKVSLATRLLYTQPRISSCPRLLPQSHAHRATAKRSTVSDLWVLPVIQANKEPKPYCGWHHPNRKVKPNKHSATVAKGYSPSNTKMTDRVSCVSQHCGHWTASVSRRATCLEMFYLSLPAA